MVIYRYYLILKYLYNLAIVCVCVYVVCLQMDLEPEGKVYIHVSLTGSFIDGKAAAVMRASCVNETFAHGVLQQCLQSLPIDFVPIMVLNNVWEPV